MDVVEIVSRSFSPEMSSDGMSCEYVTFRARPGKGPVPKGGPSLVARALRHVGVGHCTWLTSESTMARSTSLFLCKCERSFVCVTLCPLQRDVLVGADGAVWYV